MTDTDWKPLVVLRVVLSYPARSMYGRWRTQNGQRAERIHSQRFAFWRKRSCSGQSMRRYHSDMCFSGIKYHFDPRIIAMVTIELREGTIWSKWVTRSTKAAKDWSVSKRPGKIGWFLAQDMGRTTSVKWHRVFSGDLCWWTERRTLLHC